MVNKGRCFCFTVQLPAVPDSTDACPVEIPEDSRYFVCQLESAPTTGQIHLQGYFSFNKPKSLGQLKNLPGFAGAHFENARGSEQSNRDYCTKAESRLAGPWEKGVPRAQGSGHRSDLEAASESCKRGASELELAEEHPSVYLRHRSNLLALKALYSVPRGKDEVTPLYVVIGKTGLGKTRYVMEECGDDLFVKTGTGKFWDGFKGEENVLFDDFRGAYPFTELLRLANPGPYRVEIKGATVNFNPTAIWITSNLPPISWYNGRIDPAPLLRRITKVLFFTGYKEVRIWETDPEYPESGTLAWEKFKLSEEFPSCDFSASNEEITLQ